MIAHVLLLLSFMGGLLSGLVLSGKRTLTSIQGFVRWWCLASIVLVILACLAIGSFSSHLLPFLIIAGFFVTFSLYAYYRPGEIAPDISEEAIIVNTVTCWLVYATAFRSIIFYSVHLISENFRDAVLLWIMIGFVIYLNILAVWHALVGEEHTKKTKRSLVVWYLMTLILLGSRDLWTEMNLHGEIWLGVLAPGSLRASLNWEQLLEAFCIGYAFYIPFSAYILSRSDAENTDGVLARMSSIQANSTWVGFAILFVVGGYFTMTSVSELSLGTIGLTLSMLTLVAAKLRSSPATVTIPS